VTAPPVVLVTDPSVPFAHTCAVVRAAGAALGAGRLLVQLRDKASPEPVVLARALELRAVTRSVDARLVVNGPLAVAAAAAADGVHLGGAPEPLATRLAAARAALGPHALVTVPAHDDDDVRTAQACGVTAVLVSPIFATPGKGPPRGVAALSAARVIVGNAAHPWLYALGGVSAETAATCAAAGADGVAVIRALLGLPVHEVGARAEALAAPFRERERG
jgi:thiamine-phosphate pyrophosphorylase